MGSKKKQDHIDAPTSQTICGNTLADSLDTRTHICVAVSRIGGSMICGEPAEPIWRAGHRRFGTSPSRRLKTSSGWQAGAKRSNIAATRLG
jgi:hypothetical protein